MLHSWKLSYYSSIILSFLLFPKLYRNICLTPTWPYETRFFVHIILWSILSFYIDTHVHIHIHVVLIVRVWQIMVLSMYAALYEMLLMWDFSVLELVNFLFRKISGKAKTHHSGKFAPRENKPLCSSINWCHFQLHISHKAAKSISKLTRQSCDDLQPADACLG